MPTIVNTTPSTNSSNNGMGFLLGIILLIVLVFLLLQYGLPYLSRSAGTGTSVSVPSHMDVNVQHGTGK